ncbi:bifunctional aminoglycoside phosphotransferase/ATP-binding protein [Giesbergeria giesbergeri]
MAAYCHFYSNSPLPLPTMSEASNLRPLWLNQLLQGTHALAPEATCTETHISWVVLAGGQAVKFKKPLDMGFLNFSTLELRRHACLEELRINARTAPQLYQSVVAVLGPQTSPRLVPLAQLNAQEQTEVLEYGVQMQRFGADQLLAQQLAAGTLHTSHLNALAEQVAQLHRQAAVAPAGSHWGSPMLVRQQSQANLDALARLPLNEADRATLAALSDWTQQEGERLMPLFSQRQTQGHVREGHGDLHLGNLVLLHETPQLFDAIEFSEALRWIDTMADGAFLVMDLHAQGRPDLAWHFLNAWLEQSGDYAGLPLLPWYLVYRALVRAMVAGFRLGQVQSEAAQAEVWQEVRRYMALADQLRQPRARWLWLAHGVSWSGKSRHSAQLVAQRGMVRLRADAERKRLFGLAPTASSAGATPQGIYTPDATQRTYEQLALLAAQVLQAGFPVLVDATFLAQRHRAQLVAVAAQQQVPCRILAFDAPAEVLRERVQRRLAKGGNASEATVEVLQAQLAAREPLDAQEQALAVWADTTQTLDWNALLPGTD